MQADTESLSTITYHPLFSSSDCDTVLGSKDGTHFRVHSQTLRTTSGWFRAMFSLPQRTEQSELIYVDEDAATLEGLLRMICGLAIPRLDSYAEVEPILFAAEKYDMPGPLSVVRALVMTPALLSDPLRLYAISCRYGWEAEAKLASTKTLVLNLHAPEHRPVLQKLDTFALLKLFDLHHGRREALRKRLGEPPFVNDGGEASCSHCGSTVDYHTWRELKYAVIMEVDARPLGDTACDDGLENWPAARACWEARCANCNRVLYDKKETLRVIRDVFNELPVTVDYGPHELVDQTEN